MRAAWVRLRGYVKLFLTGEVAEWSKAAVLLNRLSSLCKIHNLKQILLPAKDLRRFGSSPDFTQFDVAMVTKG
jgi:hypothetical protein